MTMKKIRYWLRILHRDIGYLCVGLTLVYGISGIAVDHTKNWNPNYKISKTKTSITPLKFNKDEEIKLAPKVLAMLGEKRKPKNIFSPKTGILSVYFSQNNSLNIDLIKGEVTKEIIKPRIILKAMNYLHLNQSNWTWTWVADLFAVSLIFLAISGIFLPKGKKGMTGRGAWLTAIGIIIPVIFIIF